MLDNPQHFLKSLPTTPGIYQMYDDKQQLLYVGKAKNLKQRLSSYFRPLFAHKTRLFMEQVTKIEIILTPNENDALLLENNLIKTHKPRYNILFKDDKSFPYLLLSDHVFPRLIIYRGTLRRVHGKYFGPFPDGSAVKFMFNLLQRIFRLRVCQDSCLPCLAPKKYPLRKMNSGAKPSCEQPEFTLNVNEDCEQRRRTYRRSRPCMLYQIKLCNAPCVGYVDQEAYGVQVGLAEQFLKQQNDEIIRKLTQLMEEASKRLAYEEAASYRDQIASIHKVQAAQTVTKDKGNYDVIALTFSANDICINVLYVKRGLIVGNKHYFAAISDDFWALPEDTLRTFIFQYYLQMESGQNLPEKVLVNIRLPNMQQIAEILSKKCKSKILLRNPFGKAQKQLVSMSEANARHALSLQQQKSSDYNQSITDFVRALALSFIPQRIECFDVSHNVGEAQVVSCVVFEATGPNYRDYRRFNVQTENAGDDYAALRIALYRRYHNCKKLPDVIVIDGGLGQLHVGAEVCHKLNISRVLLIAIAKGKERKPGLEKIYILGRKEPLVLTSQNSALCFIQKIRDEAHNFALAGHRKQMIRKRCKSGLENVVGIGKMKRKALLQYFGGIRELKAAGVDDLIRVKGVSKRLAYDIYEYLHG